MKQVIIYAHPSTNSFSYKLKDAIQANASERGWQSTVRDLYEMKFDPVLWPSELELLSKGETSDIIKGEQKLISEADIISVIYPLWWAGFPAILKGYIDRVMAYGFAYKAGKDGIEGLLKNKQVYLYTSMGNRVEQYEQKGLIEAFKKIQGGEIFEFCGMQVVDHQFFPEIPSATDEQIKKHIDTAMLKFEASQVFNQ